MATIVVLMAIENFWAYFLRWFGPTTSDNVLDIIKEEEVVSATNEELIQEPEEWSYEVAFQGIYADFNKEIGLNSTTNTLEPNQVAYVVLDFENTGTEIWTQAVGTKQVFLAPMEEEYPSHICHPNWQADCQQAALMQQAEVSPGEIATFEFEILAPSFNGVFPESFVLVNNDEPLYGLPPEMVFSVINGDEQTDTDSTGQPESETPINDNTAETPATTETTPQVASNTVVLPADWHSLSAVEKIYLNPWGCHDTTQIRADNGRCLSGGYTVPNQPKQVIATTINTKTETTPQVASNTVVLPADWHSLSAVEKIYLNPWGCHDTTQIRADNGRCLSGGYTVPNQPKQVIATTINTKTETTPTSCQQHGCLAG